MKISPFSKNFVMLLGSTFSVQGFRLLTIILLARRLGVNLFGVYNYIILLTTYGFTFVEFGLKNLALREMAQGRGSKKFIAQILKVRAFLSLFAMAAVTGLFYRAFKGGPHVTAAFLFSASLFIDAFLLDFVVIAKEKLFVQALANSAQAIFVYGASLIWVRTPDQFVTFAEIFLFSHVVWAACFYFSARPVVSKLDPSTDGVSLLSLMKLGLPFLVAQFLYSMQASTDLLLLGQFHLTEYLGNYSAAIKILSIPTGVVFALINTVYPRIAKHSGDFKSRELLGVLDITTRIIWILVVPMVIGCWFMGGDLLKWFLGSNYVGAQEYLKPLSLSTALFFLGLPAMTALLVSHEMKLMMKTSALNIFVSFLTAFLALYFFSPHYLPWAMAIAQLFFMFWSWRSFERWSYLNWDDSKILVVPAILMTICLILPLGSVLRFGLAAVAYAGPLLYQRSSIKLGIQRSLKETE